MSANVWKSCLTILNNEREVLELERKISQRVKKQMEKTQKEYYLREQMKAIQKELGEKEGRAGEVEDLRSQLEKPSFRRRFEKRSRRKSTAWKNACTSAKAASFAIISIGCLGFRGRSKQRMIWILSKRKKF